MPWLLGAQLDQLFAADDVLKIVALANHVRHGVIDENLGRARTAVVVRCHHEAVRTRAHQCEQVAGLWFGEFPCKREKISTLAYRSDHVGHDRITEVAAIDRANLVISLVQHWPDKIVHRAVDNDEALHVGFLDVEHARHEDARVADQPPSGLDYYLEAEVANRL